MSKNVEVMEFEDEDLTEVPVTIGSHRLILQEANGDIVVQHRNAVLAYTRYNDQGNIASISGIASAEPLLISKCLYTTVPVDKDKPDGPVVKGKLVGLEFVSNLRHRVMKKLFNRIKEISDMNDDESVEALEKQRDELNKKIAEIKKTEEKVKNLQGGITGGSNSGESSDQG